MDDNNSSTVLPYPYDAGESGGDEKEAECDEEEEDENAAGDESKDANDTAFPPCEAWVDIVRHDEIEQLYRCIVCRESRPRVDLTACEHVLCSGCVQKLATAACPECRRPLGSSSMLATARSGWTKESRIVSNIVGNQKLWCMQGPPPPSLSRISSMRPSSASSSSSSKPILSTPPSSRSSAAASLSATPSTMSPPGMVATSGEHKEAAVVGADDDAASPSAKTPRGHIVEYRSWATHRATQCEFRRVLCGLCEMRVAHSELAEHRRASCTGRLVPCEHECGQEVRHDAQKRHAASCLNVPKACTHAGCCAIVPRHALSSHERVCAFARVPCMLRESCGCVYVGERRHHPAHIREQFVAHTVAMMLQSSQSPHWSGREHWVEFARGIERDETKGSASASSSSSSSSSAACTSDPPIAITAASSAAPPLSVAPSRSRSSTDVYKESKTASPPPPPQPSLRRDRLLRKFVSCGAPVLAASSVDGEWYTARIESPRYGADEAHVHVHYTGWPAADDEDAVPLSSARIRPMFASAEQHAAFLAALRRGTQVDVRRKDGWRAATVKWRSDAGTLLTCHESSAPSSEYLVSPDEYERCLVPSGFAINLDNINPDDRYSPSGAAAVFEAQRAKLSELVWATGLIGTAVAADALNVAVESACVPSSSSSVPTPAHESKEEKRRDDEQDEEKRGSVVTYDFESAIMRLYADWTVAPATVGVRVVPTEAADWDPVSRRVASHGTDDVNMWAHATDLVVHLLGGAARVASLKTHFTQLDARRCERRLLSSTPFDVVMATLVAVGVDPRTAFAEYHAPGASVGVWSMRWCNATRRLTTHEKPWYHRTGRLETPLRPRYCEEDRYCILAGFVDREPSRAAAVAAAEPVAQPPVPHESFDNTTSSPPPRPPRPYGMVRSRRNYLYVSDQPIGEKLNWIGVALVAPTVLLGESRTPGIDDLNLAAIEKLVGSSRAFVALLDSQLEANAAYHDWIRRMQQDRVRDQVHIFNARQKIEAEADVERADNLREVREAMAQRKLEREAKQREASPDVLGSVSSSSVPVPPRLSVLCASSSSSSPPPPSSATPRKNERPMRASFSWRRLSSEAVVPPDASNPHDILPVLRHAWNSKIAAIGPRELTQRMAAGHVP